MRALFVVGTWLLLCPFALADIARVEVNKANEQERTNNSIRVSATTKGDLLEFYAVVAVPPNGEFGAAWIEIMDRQSLVAQFRLEATTHARIPTARTISFRMSRELAERSFLNIVLDHKPNVGAKFHIELGSYVK